MVTVYSCAGLVVVGPAGACEWVFFDRLATCWFPTHFVRPDLGDWRWFWRPVVVLAVLPAQPGFVLGSSSNVAASKLEVADVCAVSCGTDEVVAS